MYLWRPIISALMGLFYGIIIRYNNAEYDKNIVPTRIITPLGFLIFLVILFFIISFGIPEAIIRTLIKKIFNKSFNEISYVEKMVKFCADTLDKYMLPITHKPAISEKEKYIHYKYIVKAFTFWRKGLMSHDENLIIKELINFRDEKYEHYLILELAGVE